MMNQIFKYIGNQRTGKVKQRQIQDERKRTNDGLDDIGLTVLIVRETLTGDPRHLRMVVGNFPLRNSYNERYLLFIQCK
jgi:hypothetical protein